MAKSKKYVISREVYKYPYCAKLDDTEDYLSDKVCRGKIKIRKKRTYTKVEFDQTAVHMHHAPDFGISLPANFDMNKYRSLD